MIAVVRQQEAKIFFRKSMLLCAVFHVFYHRLVSIHPFPNGNGRHARLMTDLLLENILKRLRFTWGSKDLSKVGHTHKRYIAALHAADEQNYEPLLEFVRT